jgi:ribosome-associated protein
MMRALEPDPLACAMPNLDFPLTGDYVELHNLLKITGLADSGGAAKQLVAAGEVKVDGQVELRKTCKIRAGQVVLFGDTRIAVREAD